MVNYSQPSPPSFHSKMSFLPHFRFPSASRRPVVATGPSAPPLTLCLDLRVHTPDESEGHSSRGSSCVIATDESEGGNSRGSSCVNAEDSDTEDSEEERETILSLRGSTPESEGTWSSRASSPDNSPDPDNAAYAATSMHTGSFNWDWEKGGFSHEWASYAEFQIWRETEERACSIELVQSSTRHGKLFTRWQLFTCGRQESGGDRGYEKKHPERQPKIGIRKSGCGCHIIVKQYPHTSTVLGRYVTEHDHEIGAANIAYTRLSGAARERIKTMLIQKIAPHEIVSLPNSKNV